MIFLYLFAFGRNRKFSISKKKFNQKRFAMTTCIFYAVNNLLLLKYLRFNFFLFGFDCLLFFYRDFSIRSISVFLFSFCCSINVKCLLSHKFVFFPCFCFNYQCSMRLRDYVFLIFLSKMPLFFFEKKITIFTKINDEKKSAAVNSNRLSRISFNPCKESILLINCICIFIFSMASSR